MRFFLISDNMDTYTGMRMAGIEGIVLREEHDLDRALSEAFANPDIGVVLITARLVNLNRKKIYDLKLTRSHPLIVEVMDRHGDGKVSDAITQYVKEAVGIKI